jgi:hypothetical protein
MWELDNTTDRNEIWQFMTGVIQYLDSSLRFVTQEELRTVMASKVSQFSPKLLMSMVNNGNIACYEAANSEGVKVQYFCSTKFQRVLPQMNP